MTARPAHTRTSRRFLRRAGEHDRGVRACTRHGSRRRGNSTRVAPPTTLLVVHHDPEVDAAPDCCAASRFARGVRRRNGPTCRRFAEALRTRCPRNVRQRGDQVPAVGTRSRRSPTRPGRARSDRSRAPRPKRGPTRSISSFRPPRRGRPACRELAPETFRTRVAHLRATARRRLRKQNRAAHGHTCAAPPRPARPAPPPGHRHRAERVGACAFGQSGTRRRPRRDPRPLAPRSGADAARDERPDVALARVVVTGSS